MNRNVQNVVFAGMAAAVIFLMTYFLSFKIPVGFLNLGDAAIIAFSMFISPTSAFAAGAIGSALADITLGYYVYAPFTFFIKGLEGLFVSLLSRKGRIEIPAVTGGLIMLFGYFISEAFLLPFIDKSFSWAVAVGDITPNAIQAAAGIAVGYIAARMLKKAGVRRI